MHLLQRLVARVARNPSYKRSRAIVKTSGTTSQGFTSVSRRRLANPAGAGALKALLRWDGSYHRTDAGGTIAPGAAIWEELKTKLEARLLGPMGPAAYGLSIAPSQNHQFDTSTGEAAALRLLGPRGYARAAESAADTLRQRFGSADPRDWRLPRPGYEVVVQGAGSAPDLMFFDRGSWEQSVALGRRGH